ncbi:MAG: CubicO group peptidase (beta-lactamase class C family) [Gammaproteobacteria bacterium]|jgi:CubicO group peptidase (beta-lactamase class C family)
MKDLLIATVFLCSLISLGQQSTASQELAAIENGLLLPRIVAGTVFETYNLEERMKVLNVPGVSIAVVRKGEIRFAKGYGMANTTTGTKVTTETLFQAGSISKPLAALGALKLVEEGKLDLDTDVNTYLKNWKVPDNEFTKDQKITLRHLLTHTAGTTVHGFPGYRQTASMPSTSGVLEGKGNTDAIDVDTQPGTNWRYSGGGYTIMELIVENVTGMELDAYLDPTILLPLGMSHSTYAQPLPESKHAIASAAYTSDGEIVDGYWNNYPEQAAAGLWTTPIDLATYYIAIQEIMAGKRTGPLAKATVEQMLTQHKNSWGLGPTLKMMDGVLLFGHGGKNEGFSNNMMGFVNKGDAVVVMTNGDNGTKIIQEILAAVSAQYDWNIVNPRTINTLTPSTDLLEAIIGNFKSKRQLLPKGDYIVEMKIEDGQLNVYDKTNEELTIFLQIDTLTFMDISSGDILEFKREADQSIKSVMYNRQMEFVRVD